MVSFDAGQGASAQLLRKRYTVCAQDRCDPCNPKRFENLSLVALICKDAYLNDHHCPDTDKRHKTLIDRLKTANHKDTLTVICIPAHIPNYPRSGLYESWDNSYVVVANSSDDLREPGSFIAKVDAGQAIVREECQGRKNVVRVAKLH